VRVLGLAAAGMLALTAPLAGHAAPSGSVGIGREIYLPLQTQPGTLSSDRRLRPHARKAEERVRRLTAERKTYTWPAT
jgi:hypothetical protein